MTSMEKPGNTKAGAETRVEPAHSAKPGKQAKQERLARALKQNLLRRKAANPLSDKE